MPTKDKTEIKEEKEMTTKKPSKKKEVKEMTTEKPSKKKETDKSLKKETIANLREIRTAVKDAIDQGADSIEKVHQTIAKLPLTYLEKVEKIEDDAKDVKDVQKKTIGHVYDLIKTVNDKVSDITKEILDKMDSK